MNVTMLIHEAPEDVAARTDPARAPAYWGAWKSYADALAEAGLVQGGAGLQAPETATLIRGDRVLDGPYSETREQLGSYFTLEVPDWRRPRPGPRAASPPRLAPSSSGPTRR